MVSKPLVAQEAESTDQPHQLIACAITLSLGLSGRTATSTRSPNSLKSESKYFRVKGVVMERAPLRKVVSSLSEPTGTWRIGEFPLNSTIALRSCCDLTGEGTETGTGNGTGTGTGTGTGGVESATKVWGMTPFLPLNSASHHPFGSFLVTVSTSPTEKESSTGLMAV